MKRRTKSTANAEEKQVDLEPLLRRLEVISRSLGILALRMAPTRHKTDTDRIHFLQGMGFDRNEIAAMLGTTPGTVSVRLSEKTSKRKSTKRRRSK